MKKSLMAVVVMAMIFCFFPVAGAGVIQLDEKYLGETIYISPMDPPQSPWNVDGNGYVRIPAYFRNNTINPISVSIGPSWWWIEGDSLFFSWDTSPVFEEHYLLPGENIELDLVVGGFRMEPGTYKTSPAEIGDNLILREFGVMASINGCDEFPFAIFTAPGKYLFRAEVIGSPVPIPPSLFLLGTGLISLLAVRKRKKSYY